MLLFNLILVAFIIVTNHESIPLYLLQLRGPVYYLYFLVVVDLLLYKVHFEFQPSLLRTIPPIREPLLARLGEYTALS